MKKPQSTRNRSIEEIERHLREDEIVKTERVLGGSAYWGRAEAEFANLTAGEEDPKRRQKMIRRQKELAVQLKGLSRNDREQILLDEINRWKNEKK